MATTQQKWKNLATLIKAKAEHKEKFGNRRSYMRETIACHIINIGFRKQVFISYLEDTIQEKYQKYITERKITIPKLDNITEYNCETDCPICFETFGDDDDDATIAEGDNCEHQICRECFEKIVNDTNRCPICREKLDDNKENDTDTDTDDDESIWGDNERPTTDLFYGRRWYNVEENRIETYNGEEWRPNNNHMSMSRFIVRYSFNGSNEASPLLRDDGTCCIVCGIQRTPEVYEFMENIYPDGYTFPADMIMDEWGQEDYFNAEIEEPNTRCYDCDLKFHLLQGFWVNR